MLFNSLEFAFFLPIVFLLYWFVTHRSIKLQNALLLLASYFFYGWWDWRFLSLIAFSSLVDYFVGLSLANAETRMKRRLLILVSILVNIGFLGFFKYFNFFAESFAQAFTLLGDPLEISSLKIILPVGISFYTFQTLSYSIDIYRKKIAPTKDFVAFFAFVSFFPQLVAGPIERASNLLPQFHNKRNFKYDEAVDGCRQILWGLFKKIVIADNCAEFVNIIFEDPTAHSSSTLILGVILFSFQIYGDFSGYSDIAIGVARLFGFKLMRNFAYPYFSRNIGEFWRRWHITLSTWFRDYLYIPIGGSRGSTLLQIRNIFIVFLVSGFWHGANWTFLLWGGLHALFFIPLVLMKRNRTFLHSIETKWLFPSLKEGLLMVFTFLIVSLAWVFFRAESVSESLLYFQGMFSNSILTVPDILRDIKAIVLILFIFGMLFIEWIARDHQFGIERITLKWSRPVRYGFYYGLTMVIFMFKGIPQDFIYFQF